MRETIARQLKFARESAGLTQNEVADLLRMERGSYAQYETGRNLVPIDKLYEISRVLNTPVYTLLDIPVGKFDPDETELIRLYRLAHTYLKKVVFLFLRSITRMPPDEITGPLPEEVPHPGDEDIMDVFKSLDPHRQRQVYDFARWMLREQFNPLNSTGQRRVTEEKRQEWEKAIEHIDLLQAVNEADPLVIQQVISRLQNMLSGKR